MWQIDGNKRRWEAFPTSVHRLHVRGRAPAYWPEQVSPRSRIELTRSVDLLLRELAAPVVLADGFSVVDDGLVEGELIELPLLSIVPRTSTLWFTYFERSSLPLALSLRPFAQELLAPIEDDPVVPAVDPVVGLVVVGFGLVEDGLVLLAVEPVLELPADTFVRMKSPDDVVELLAVVLGVVLPVVPAAPDESPFCTHPVTVTVCPLVLCRSLCELLEVLCAPTPTAMAAARTVPNMN